MNFGIILLCITAIMIGKLFKKGEAPSLFVPLAGILGNLLMQQTLFKLGVNLKYFDAFQALFVLSILSIKKRNANLTLDHLGV